MQSESTIPLFPLGLVLIPRLPLPLHIFEERYKLMLGECLAEDKEFGIAYYNAADIKTAGCTARILKVIKRYDDGRLDILTHGQRRFLIREIYDSKAYLEARITYFDDEGFSHEEKQRFLEMTSTVERLKKSVESLENIIERMKITAEIHKIIGGNGNIKRGSGSN